MAKQNAKSAAHEMQSMFDPQNYQNVFKTWASANEKLMSIGAKAASRTNDIMADTANEAVANARDVTKVRQEPAEYAKAYSEFMQKQMELFTRTMQSVSDEMRDFGSETTDLASKTGEEMTSKVAANADNAAKTARSAADKAA